MGVLPLSGACGTICISIVATLVTEVLFEQILICTLLCIELNIIVKKMRNGYFTIIVITGVCATT